MNIQTWSHGNVFCLDDFFITEKYRGKGYGKKALKDLEKYAKENGIKRIQLFGENSNKKAIKFYRKQNYNEQEINLFLKYIEN